MKAFLDDEKTMSLCGESFSHLFCRTVPELLLEATRGRHVGRERGNKWCAPTLFFLSLSLAKVAFRSGVKYCADREKCGEQR